MSLEGVVLREVNRSQRASADWLPHRRSAEETNPPQRRRMVIARD